MQNNKRISRSTKLFKTDNNNKKKKKSVKKYD